MNIFRETGRPDPALVSSGTGGTPGQIVSGVADKHIVICDILSENNGSLGIASAGASTFAYVVSGSMNLTSPIRVAKGESVYANSSAGNVTITYYLEK